MYFRKYVFNICHLSNRISKFLWNILLFSHFWIRKQIYCSLDLRFNLFWIYAVFSTSNLKVLYYLNYILKKKKKIKHWLSYDSSRLLDSWFLEFQAKAVEIKNGANQMVLEVMKKKSYPAFQKPLFCYLCALQKKSLTK